MTVNLDELHLCVGVVAIVLELTEIVVNLISYSYSGALRAREPPEKTECLLVRRLCAPRGGDKRESNILTVYLSMLTCPGNSLQTRTWHTRRSCSVAKPRAAGIVSLQPAIRCSV